jgi:hypothetical protein
LSYFNSQKEGKTPVGYSLNPARLTNWLLIAALVFGILFSGFSTQSTAFASSKDAGKATASGQGSPVASMGILTPSVTLAKTGPATVKDGGTLSYNLKITNSDPISYFGELIDLYPTEVTYSGPISFTDETTHACFTLPGPPGITAQGITQVDETDVGGLVFCYYIVQPNSSLTINLEFTANGTGSKCFVNQSATLFVPFYGTGPTLKNISGADPAKGIQNNTGPSDILYSDASTCIADTPTPPADLIAQLRVNPDHTAFIDPNSDISYNLLVKNIGIGEADRATVTFPFDNNLDVGYLSSEDPNVWVSGVDTTSEQHSVTLSFPTIQPGGVYSATLVMRPSATAVPGSTELTRFKVKWDDAERAGKSAASNQVHFAFSDQSGSTFNLNDGEVQTFDPATATVSNGSQQVFTADFFAPGEHVSAWYTAPDGTSTSLGTVLAGDNGEISLTFSPVGLTAGDNYSISAYGNRSGVYASAVATIGS